MRFSPYDEEEIRDQEEIADLAAAAYGDTWPRRLPLPLLRIGGHTPVISPSATPRKRDGLMASRCGRVNLSGQP
jgi:hypothetical protein